MPQIYLSSTYLDLQAHRAAVVNQFAKMKLRVIAMEDYVARDERPLDACLKDVRESHLYVGLFAWRYGFIPTQENPQKLSITELEYREAVTRSIPRLVFLLDETTQWLPAMLDSHSGQGDSGRRIRDLRNMLTNDRIATSFSSPEDLAAKVSAAVHLANAVSSASDASIDIARIVGNDSIDLPEILLNQSYVPYIIQQLSQLGDSPLIKIDLRDGTHWWSTRLYALATLAADFTSVEWLLFLDRGTQYSGMVRPRDLRLALAAVQPELELQYHLAVVDPLGAQFNREMYAGQLLQTLVARYRALPGGEEGLRFLVNAAWLRQHVPALSLVKVVHSGPFDPLATYQMLQAPTPYVPITDRHGSLIKVIDRLGVSTEIARTIVERMMGRKKTDETQT